MTSTLPRQEESQSTVNISALISQARDLAPPQALELLGPHFSNQRSNWDYVSLLTEKALLAGMAEPALQGLLAMKDLKPTDLKAFINEVKYYLLTTHVYEALDLMNSLESLSIKNDELLDLKMAVKRVIQKMRLQAGQLSVRMLIVLDDQLSVPTQSLIQKLKQFNQGLHISVLAKAEHLEALKSWKQIDDVITTLPEDGDYQIGIVATYAREQGDQLFLELQKRIHFMVRDVRPPQEHELSTWQDRFENLLGLPSLERNRGVAAERYPLQAGAASLNHCTLMVCWGELREHAMLTGVLQEYNRQFPQEKLVVMVPYNLAAPVVALYRDLPFVSEVVAGLTSHRDPFEDARLRLQVIIEEAQKFALNEGFQKLYFLPGKYSGEAGLEKHLTRRFSHELEMQLPDNQPLAPCLGVSVDDLKRATEFRQGSTKPYILMQTRGSNVLKNLQAHDIHSLIMPFPEHDIYEVGSSSAARCQSIDPQDLGLIKALAAYADQVIAVDDFLLQVGAAFQRPCVAIYTVSPVLESLPFKTEVNLTGIDSQLTQLQQAQTSLSIFSATATEVSEKKLAG